MTKHTPGKLIVYSSTYGVGVTPEDETEEDIADCEVCFSRSKEEMLANAKRIAHTWNCHDELVEALEQIINNANGDFECDDGERGWLIHDDHMSFARDIIAKAKGE